MFLVLARLTQLYKVRYHKLSHYPSTIKLIIEDESSEEHMFEIIYLPYSENAELVKRMGFFFEREYDEKYNVKRFAICENKWMLYNEASKLWNIYQISVHLFSCHMTHRRVHYFIIPKN